MAMTERETQGLEAPPAGEWEIDAAHSNVTFTARYMMLTKVRGRFGDHAGTIHIGEGPEDSWAQVTIKSATSSNPTFPNVQPFCRVIAAATPTVHSNIGFEVWMPLSGWNGKFAGVGSGGCVPGTA